jgi:hypothetical protein
MLFVKRTRLKVVGDNDTALIKQDIQDILRLLVCKRDGGCILRKVRHCGGEAVVEDDKIISNNVIQADHLITRGNSATFADARLVVSLCSRCHLWKKWNEKEYDFLIARIIPKENLRLWNACEKDRHAHKTKKMDWRMELLALQREYAIMQ